MKSTWLIILGIIGLLSVGIVIFFGLDFSNFNKPEQFITKTVIEQREIVVNGGVRAGFDGRSRVEIPVDLPDNTIKWYYSFSTSKGVSGTKNLNLLIQLSPLLLDISGATSTILSQLEVPEGVAAADVYLFYDDTSLNKFITKQDFMGEEFYFSQEGSVFNTKQAVVEMDEIKSGRVFLGIRNPDALDAIIMSLEVVAIVENPEYKLKLKENTQESTVLNEPAKSIDPLTRTISELEELMNGGEIVTVDLNEYGRFSFDMGSASSGRVAGNLLDVSIRTESRPEEPGCADICPPRQIIYFECLENNKCVYDPAAPEYGNNKSGVITIYSIERGRNIYEMLRTIQSLLKNR